MVCSYISKANKTGVKRHKYATIAGEKSIVSFEYRNHGVYEKHSPTVS